MYDNSVYCGVGLESWGGGGGIWGIGMTSKYVRCFVLPPSSLNSSAVLVLFESRHTCS